MAASDLKSHSYDVVVIGAGGAGLRAAIEASAQRVKVALVCKSLLGKAHTVMAEGGAAAALATVMKEDSWRVHFRDTMRGGKMHNNWRMAQIHAQEAPTRSTDSRRGARCSTPHPAAPSTHARLGVPPTAGLRTWAVAPVSRGF